MTRGRFRTGVGPFQQSIIGHPPAVVSNAVFQINLSKNEKKYTTCRNELYHDLETTDLSQLSTDEQIDYLMNMKSQLNKRRIIEEENKKLFGFYESFTAIYDIIMKYEEKA